MRAIKSRFLAPASCGGGVLLFALFIARFGAPSSSAQANNSSGARHFDEKVAPLLAKHCIECHGPDSKKARLDLSRKSAAFGGGKSGKVIVPGKPAESLLWQNVESDEMPENRPPLTADEKKVLREWIDAGAVWSEDENAPLDYMEKKRDADHWVRRLTIPEYIETVRSALGVDIRQEAEAILPRDLRADGFNNTAYNLGVDLSHIQGYAALARIIVRRMEVLEFAAEYSDCKELDDDCMRKFISGAGKWLLRGPLEEDEVNSFLKVASAVRTAEGDFEEALRFVLEAMLQSPRFIYRIEKEPPEGKPRAVGAYELASRLSYILWGAPPNRELYRAAEAGELSNSETIHSQVKRMLEDRRAIERSSRFLSEWLNLDRLDSLSPDEKRYPGWDDRLAGDMRRETLAFFKEVAWKQKRPLVDLLNAEVTFATPRLAHHYGLDWKISKKGLEALYTFEEGKGDTVRDRSGKSDPFNLKISDSSAVEWGEGRLTVEKPVLISSEGPAKRLTDAIKKTRAISIEIWITGANTEQKGPARIVSLSSGPSERNFTLGQDADRFEVRFRTARTDRNGLPGLSSPNGSVEPRLTHIVYTREAKSRAAIYINGRETEFHNNGGSLGNWNGDFHLALANETTKDRPWKGTFHFVAIYSRALDPKEIRSRASGLVRYDLSSNPARAGLLTQGSTLTIGGDEASTVTRGLFLLKDFLNGKVEDPPPCLDTTPIPPKPGLSKRAVAETRVNSAACGGCHSKFEPLAFGIEKFDGLGAYHDKDEHGNKLLDHGEILFPGEEAPVPFKSGAEMMDLLAKSERVRKVITRKVAQFALGRPLTEADAPIIDQIHGTAQEGGGTYASLITAIVMSDLVQKSHIETGNK